MVSEPLAGRRTAPKEVGLGIVYPRNRRHEEAAHTGHGQPQHARARNVRAASLSTPPSKHGFELNVLAGQCLKGRNRDELASKVAHWQAHRNNRNSTINWQFTTEKARTKLRRLYPTRDVT